MTAFFRCHAFLWQDTRQLAERNIALDNVIQGAVTHRVQARIEGQRTQFADRRMARYRIAQLTVELQILDNPDPATGAGATCRDSSENSGGLPSETAP